MSGSNDVINNENKFFNHGPGQVFSLNNNMYQASCPVMIAGWFLLALWSDWITIRLKMSDKVKR